MKKLVYFLVFFLMLGFMLPQQSFAQKKVLTRNEIRKIEKRKRKQARLKASLKSRAYYANLLKKHYFVFQADHLYGPGGMSYSVTPDINFLAVVKNKVILQFGFDGVMGWNGVGGLTAEGFLDNYKFHPGKTVKQAMMITSNIRPRGGGSTPYLTMTVNNDGYAYLDVMMGIRGKISMSGQLVAPSQSSVYKGQTLY